jgi:2-polyprenyl-6-methoxyphenol hydroxylase-like FAD-dependent oxidoreductase
MFQSTISMPTDDQHQSSHALVIGGGIAGLLAAKVLTKYFNRVTIVERDRFPEQPEQRQGVPQALHLHVLLKRGQEIMEQLFSGLEAELAEAGVPAMDWAADVSWFSIGGWFPRLPSGLITRTPSRNLLEWTIRRRLATCERVVFVEAGQVTSLLSNPSRTSLTGVRVRFRNEPEVDLTADLVVDASGRNSRAPQWLEAMGYSPVQQTVINSFFGYASRWYQRPEGLKSDWQSLFIAEKPPAETRSGVLSTVESNRWVVTLAGVGRDYPPTDEVGFLEFARSLRSAAIYEAIKDARPLSPIYAYQRMENRLRHYEKLSRLPENFVLVGDAVCALNPVYGQGMTVAALAALTLEQCLSQQLSSHPDGNLIDLSRRFQKQLSKVIAAPWLLTTGEDFRWPTTEGGQPDLITRLMHQYMDEVLMLSVERAEIHKVFLEVMHQLKPPSTFFHPRISLQVLKQVINWPRKDQRFTEGQGLRKLLSHFVEPFLGSLRLHNH